MLESLSKTDKMVPSIIMPTIGDTLYIYRQGLIYNILREPGVLIRRTSTASGGPTATALKMNLRFIEWNHWLAKNMMEWLDAFLKTSECF